MDRAYSLGLFEWSLDRSDKIIMGPMFIQLKEGLATIGSRLLAYVTCAYPVGDPFVVGVAGRHLWSQRLLLTLTLTGLGSG